MADIDSSIIFIFHKYLFWIISGFQILFIGALIIAFFQCKNHRHPLILTFLIVSWLASWIALLPFLAGVWDEARDLSLYRSNVNAGSVQFTACQANAMLIVYLWTVISGLVSFFSAEVFRVMLKCSKIAFLKKYERSSNGDDQKSSDMNFSDCRNPEHCFKIQSSRASSRLHSFPSELINQIRKRTQRRTLVVWECFLVMAPFITSLPALIINARRFTKYDWGAVHADYFICSAPGPNVQLRLYTLLLWHLVPSCILSFICLVVYFFYCRKTMARTDSRFCLKLTLRLGALSVLTGFGALLCAISIKGFYKRETYRALKVRWVLPVYMICFPLLASFFFLDSYILKVWASWSNQLISMSFFKKKTSPKVQSSSSNKEEKPKTLNQSIGWLDTNSKNRFEKERETFGFDQPIPDLEELVLRPIDFGSSAHFNNSRLPPIPEPLNQRLTRYSIIHDPINNSRVSVTHYRQTILVKFPSDAPKLSKPETAHHL